jgi:hypothetical protein
VVRWVHGFWDSGLEHAWGDAPEWWLVDAVHFYHRALLETLDKVKEKPTSGLQVEEKPGGGIKIRG